MPPGEYILRISAPILCPVYNTDFFTSRKYQLTSATTHNVAGSNTTEYRVTVSGGNITLADTFVEDLTEPAGNDFTSFQVYISDSDNGGTTINDLWTDTRIHKARVTLGDSGLDLVYGYTDHNGFFYGTIPDFASATDLTVKSIRSGQYTFNAAGATAYDLVTGASWGTGINDGTGKIGIFRTASTNIKNFSRSLVQGNFVGQKREGIIVTPTFATSASPSDSNGDFSLLLYADTEYYINNGLTGNGINNVSLYFSSDDISTILAFLPTNSAANLNLNTNNVGTATPLVLTSLFSNTIIASVLSKPAFKGGYSTIIGIVYMDEGDRKTAVCLMPDNELNIPFYNIRGNLFNATVKMEIFNEPPDWAVKYHMVRLRNTQHTTFFQWAANNIAFVEADLTTTGPWTSAATKFMKINVDNIGYYNTNLFPGATLNYTPVAGDRIRLIANSSGAVFSTLYEYEILAVSGNDIYINKENSINFASPFNYGLIFEIYTPRNNSPTDLYYEIGEAFPIETAVFNGIKKKYHTGSVQNQSYGPLPAQVVTPAIITTTQGGSYKRIRKIPVNNNTQFINWLVDDESISDFYPSKADGTGRPNIDDPAITRVDRPGAIRFSNTYITDTQVNGLRNFEALNQTQLSRLYGLIEKMLFVRDSILMCLCHNSVTVSLYVNKAILKTATGENIVAFADEVIPKYSVNKMERTFGTQHPESVTVSDEGDVLYYDESQGVWVRSSGNALIAISDYGMKPTFKFLADKRKPFPVSKNFVPAVYDVFKDEMRVTYGALAAASPLAASATFEIPYFEVNTPQPAGFPKIVVAVQPTRQILINESLTGDTFPILHTSEIIALLINKNTPSTGWSASVTPLGLLIITAPLTYPYPNAGLVITFNYYDADGNLQTKSFSFKLNNAVPPTNEEYIPGVPPLTTSFVKNKNGWPAYYEYYPEYYGQVKSSFVAFSNGNLYLHSAKAKPNDFFGVYHPMRLVFTVNDHNGPTRNQEKIFKALQVNINNNDTFCPRVTTPVTEQNPQGQLTEITKEHFRNILNKIFAAIPMDKLDPAFTNTNEAWVNGRPIAGQSLEVTIVNDGGKKFKLSDIETIYIINEYS